MLRVSCNKAALETGYNQRPVCAIDDEMDVKLTMEPPRGNKGRTALAACTALTRLMSKALSQSSRLEAIPSSR